MAGLYWCLKITAIYITLSCAVDALDEPRVTTSGSPDFFWEVDIHHKRTSATLYARRARINIPARSISDLTYTKMAKIAILEMADLAALQP